MHENLLDSEKWLIRVLDWMGRRRWLAFLKLPKWITDTRLKVDKDIDNVNNAGWGQSVRFTSLRIIEIYWRHEADLVLQQLKDLSSEIVDPRWRAMYSLSPELNKLRTNIDSFVAGYMGHNFIGYSLPLNNSRWLKSMELRLETDSPYSFRLELTFFPSDVLRYYLWRICNCQIPAKLGPIGLHRNASTHRFGWQMKVLYGSERKRILMERALKLCREEAFDWIISHVPGVFSRQHGKLPTLECFCFLDLPEELKNAAAHIGILPNRDFNPSFSTFLVKVDETNRDPYADEENGVTFFAAQSHSVPSYPLVTRALTSNREEFPGFVLLMLNTMQSYLSLLRRKIWQLERTLEHAIESAHAAKGNFLVEVENRLDRFESYFKIISLPKDTNRRMQFGFLGERYAYRVPVNTSSGTDWRDQYYAKVAQAEIEFLSDSIAQSIESLRKRVTSVTEQRLANSNLKLQKAVLWITIVVGIAAIIQLFVTLLSNN